MHNSYFLNSTVNSKGREISYVNEWQPMDCVYSSGLTKLDSLCCWLCCFCRI